MKRVSQTCALLCLWLFVCGSLQSAPPQAPPMVMDYFEAAQLAKKEGKPLVTFRGCQSYPIAGAIVCEVSATDSRFAKFPARCILAPKGVNVMRSGICSGGGCQGAGSCAAGGSCNSCSSCNASKPFAQAVGGCANGNCGTSQPVQRFPLFR